ncbi:PREDICTED: uncharacterized protein LOC109219546 [Nicotiana attenuata]|uniref:Cotton fiber protein n=1 Tax=Nicotiana attenuata TaxID=49451 RepID=A0A1J6K7A8_NICAT|nr:PREDICTED: uncharacterized protein LOC109219546 [Nicotiana attenuata]OIT20928.1 hypothetical protein A4A49_36682 [Nicotiana attenuata]
MPKKRSPIFQKLSSLLNTSIFLAKMKNPIIPRLVSLKRARKMKKFSLLKHYNYGYVQEYQFSPSNTPLLQYHRKKSLKKQRSYRDFCSVFYISKCLGLMNGQGEEKMRYPVLELEGLASMEDAVVAREFSEFSEGDDFIDERAEKFIQRFYEEMRLQRQESLLEQFNAMVDN